MMTEASWQKAFYCMLAVLAAILLASVPVHAENPGLSPELQAELEALLAGEEEVAIYEFPEIEPEYSFSFGFGYVSNKGPDSIGRYYYLESSPTIGGHARIFSYPNRFYLEVDAENIWDSFTDLRYAYGDTFLFRWTNIRLYHNYELRPLIDLDTSTSSPGVDASGCTASCGTGATINKAFLRYKTPDYPAHLYLDYFFIGRNGDRQHMMLGGSGYYNNIVRTSEEGDTGSYFYRYETGVNAHVGHMEVQYAFTRQYFEPDTDASYGSITANNAWAAGSYPHHKIPQVEGVSHTFKTHTSYTGKLVAAATLTIKEYKNETSGAKSDYVLAHTSLTWMPVTRLTFVVRYRHNEMQVENPSSVTITDASNSANSYTYTVKPSISYSQDSLRVIGRYRPVTGLTLTGNYSVDRIERENADLWGLDSDTTTKTVVGADASLKVSRTLRVKAGYEVKDVKDPAYNSEPDSESTGKFSATWTPLGWVSANVAYSLRQGERGDLDYDGISNARDRETSNEHLIAAVSFLMNEDATVTLGYFMFREHIKQDIVYSDLGGTPLISPGVVQQGSTAGYSIDLSFNASQRMTIYTGVSYAVSDASFDTNNRDLLEPISLASLNDFEYNETAFNASGDYQLGEASSVSLEYSYRRLDEALDNPNDGIEDGEVQIASVMYRKKW